ncbi:MAG: UDP-4-amino-4,6-dideoxy-N-acetyl-beta-L-altrosamine N-acetyltransferase [Bacteroidales bacterium]|nr:UDP-4-amino-4,6-dideoxy-N-acetyl-beta-L-altrosamine N-acetyltransferase [Bacteroidales bacterium]
MITYEGKYVRLRPIRKSDVEKSIIWRNDPEIRDNAMGYRFPVTEKMEDNWFESALDEPNRNRVVFAIETIEKKTLIGFTQLNHIDWISRRCYFGIIIGEKEFQGKGMGWDSMQVLFNYAFECLNLKKICLEVVSFNENAIRLYRKFGFIEEGVLREHVYLEKKYHDLLLMRIFDKEFRERH